MTEPDLARYARQIIYSPIGEAGQRRLLDAHVTIIGVGATGSVLANHLVRAGVGHLRLIDRDFVELNNLQRQLLYDEDDIAQMLPKAVAAARKLQRINSTIEIAHLVADVNPDNILQLIQDADVVLDGTDNFATRYLINDACVKLGKPWVYCGVLASYGMTHTVRPGVTACLRCIMGEIPAPGTVQTCDTAGIIGPIVALMELHCGRRGAQALVGSGTRLNDGMIHIDLWDGSFDGFDLGGPRPEAAHRVGSGSSTSSTWKPACAPDLLVRPRCRPGERGGRTCGRPPAGRTGPPAQGPERHGHPPGRLPAARLVMATR